MILEIKTDIKWLSESAIYIQEMLVNEFSFSEPHIAWLNETINNDLKDWVFGYRTEACVGRQASFGVCSYAIIALAFFWTVWSWST